MLVRNVGRAREPKVEHEHTEVAQDEEEADDREGLSLEPVEPLLLDQYEDYEYKLCGNEAGTKDE